MSSYRRPDPAKVFFRAAILLVGVALTWACAAFGLLLERELFVGHACSIGPGKLAVQRVRAVETAIARYQIDRGPCPRSASDLADSGLISARDLVDPWGRRIHFACADHEVRVASAGRDGEFGTADDVKNER